MRLFSLQYQCGNVIWPLLTVYVVSLDLSVDRSLKRHQHDYTELKYNEFSEALRSCLWRHKRYEMSVVPFTHDVILDAVLSKLQLPAAVHETHFDWNSGLHWSNLSFAYDDAYGYKHKHIFSASSPLSYGDAKNSVAFKALQYVKVLYGFDIVDYNLAELTDLRARVKLYTEFELAGAEGFADLVRNYEELRFKYGKALNFITAITQAYKSFDFTDLIGAP